MTSSQSESTDEQLVTDRSLVHRVRDGDEEAARDLYERYVQRLHGLIESKMGQRLRAELAPEDIVQSVFRSIFRGVKAGLYDAPPGETLWNLMAVVAVNKLSRNGKRISARCRDTDRTVRLTEAEQQASSFSLTSELLELEIREVLELLRDADREILELRLKSHTLEEISFHTGRSLRTVERSLQKSRQLLINMVFDDMA